MGRTSLQEKRLRFFERGNTHCPICLTPFTEPDVRAGEVVTLEHAPQHFPMVGWPWSASLPLRRLNGRPATPAEEDTMNQPARTARPPAAPALREQHVERITAAAEASHAPATLRNYRAAWGRFRQWCDREEVEPLPAAAESVAAYVAERAEDRSLSTVRLA